MVQIGEYECSLNNGIIMLAYKHEYSISLTNIPEEYLYNIFTFTDDVGNLINMQSIYTDWVGPKVIHVKDEGACTLTVNVDTNRTSGSHATVSVNNGNMKSIGSNDYVDIFVFNVPYDQDVEVTVYNPDDPDVQARYVGIDSNPDYGQFDINTISNTVHIYSSSTEVYAKLKGKTYVGVLPNAYGGCGDRFVNPDTWVVRIDNGGCVHIDPHLGCDGYWVYIPAATGTSVKIEANTNDITTDDGVFHFDMFYDQNTCSEIMNSTIEFIAGSDVITGCDVTKSYYAIYKQK